MILRSSKPFALFWGILIAICASATPDPQQTMTGHAGLMYIGTIDHKLLIIDQDKEQVVGEIPITGIARTTALSADQKTLYVINTHMTIEMVDLVARKTVGTIDLTEPGNTARITANALSWLAY